MSVSDMSDTLFTPFSVRGLTIPNRIVMAPMTRGFSPDGVPGQNVADYYKRRGDSDVGLIITEGTVIDREGSSNDANYPKFHGEKPLAGWKAVVEAVAQTPGKPDIIRRPNPTVRPVSPIRANRSFLRRQMKRSPIWSTATPNRRAMRRSLALTPSKSTAHMAI